MIKDENPIIWQIAQKSVKAVWNRKGLKTT